jgi:hypothetical protein
MEPSSLQSLDRHRAPDRRPAVSLSHVTVAPACVRLQLTRAAAQAIVPASHFGVVAADPGTRPFSALPCRFKAAALTFPGAFATQSSHTRIPKREALRFWLSHRELVSPLALQHDSGLQIATRNYGLEPHPERWLRIFRVRF